MGYPSSVHSMSAHSLRSMSMLEYREKTKYRGWFVRFLQLFFSLFLLLLSIDLAFWGLSRIGPWDLAVEGGIVFREGQKPMEFRKWCGGRMHVDPHADPALTLSWTCNGRMEEIPVGFVNSTMKFNLLNVFSETRIVIDDSTLLILDLSWSLPELWGWRFHAAMGGPILYRLIAPTLDPEFMPANPPPRPCPRKPPVLPIKTEIAVRRVIHFKAGVREKAAILSESMAPRLKIDATSANATANISWVPFIPNWGNFSLSLAHPESRIHFVSRGNYHFGALSSTITLTVDKSYFYFDLYEKVPSLFEPLEGLRDWLDFNNKSPLQCS